MSDKKILVVDDEEDLLELLSFNLEREGYQVRCASTGEEALEKVREDLPDMILLDLMLPGIDGWDVCKELKSDPNTRKIPIIMITARKEDSDVVTSLELGADDYLSKPFSPRVLLARMKVLFRNRKPSVDEEKQVVRIHDLLINPSRHEISVAGKSVAVTVTQFRLLHFLARRAGRVFSRDQIIEAIKGDDYPVTPRSVDVQMLQLRGRLGKAGNYIETIRGVGYRFKEKLEEE